MIKLKQIIKTVFIMNRITIDKIKRRSGSVQMNDEALCGANIEV